MRVAVGANHSGYLVREMLIEMIRGFAHEVVDLGVSDSRPVDYPEIAAALRTWLDRAKSIAVSWLVARVWGCVLPPTKCRGSGRFRATT